MSQAQLMAQAAPAQERPPASAGADARRRVGITEEIAHAGRCAGAGVEEQPRRRDDSDHRRAGDLQRGRSRWRVRSAAQPPVFVPAPGNTGELAHRRIGNGKLPSRACFRTGIQWRVPPARHALSARLQRAASNNGQPVRHAQSSVSQRAEPERDAAADAGPSRGRRAAPLDIAKQNTISPMRSSGSRSWT